MTKEDRLRSIQNIINNVTNNNSVFVDARVLLPALEAIKEDMIERYSPTDLDPSSQFCDPLRRIIQQS